MFDDIDHFLQSDPFAKSSAHPVLYLKEGEMREVCVLYAVCHGFTTLTERIEHEVAHNLLEKLMQLFTSRIKHFGGFIDKFKGDMVMALFGAKVASEQDTERAIEAGLQMLAVLKQFNQAAAKLLRQEIDIALRIGINTGEVTADKVDENHEGDFPVVGDAGNLASLMAANAPLNKIIMPAATMRRVVHSFEFEPHGRVQVKGKAEPVDTWLVARHRRQGSQRRQASRTLFVGREAEMTRLQQKYQRVVARLESLSTPSVTPISPTEKPIVVGLKGEAGMGKSRLVDEFLRSREGTLFYLHGVAPRLLPQSYGLFTAMIKRHLNITPLDDNQTSLDKLEAGLKDLEQYLDAEESKARLMNSLPILAHLLGLPAEDTRLSLPPKDLQPHLQTAIRYFIEASAAKANQSGVPLVVVLEDWHWGDDPSLATLEFLLFTLNLEERRQGTALKHILFILTYRPEYAPSRGVLADSQFEEIDLSLLNPEAARALVGSIVGETVIPDETMALVFSKSDGNPFFVEEWADLVAESPLTAGGKFAVPGTLQALIKARLDQLKPEAKRLLQNAAVLGREFLGQLLRGMEQKGQQPQELGDELSALEARNLLLPLSGGRFSAYMFKHILTRDVAYDTLVLPNRKALHRIAGEVIEEMLSDRLEDYYGDLADHYDKGEVWDKAAEYLLKASDRAKDCYDNQAALKYYDRLIQLQAERPGVLTPQYLVKARLGKGAVLKLTGEWQAAAVEYQLAVNLAYEIEDRLLAARVLCTRGALFQETSKYDMALDDLQKSLAIAEELGDKELISAAVGNMGMVFHNQGDNDRALACFQKALSIDEEMGDRKGISKSVGNMGSVFAERGDYDHALECYQKGLSIAEELGDREVIAGTVGGMGCVFFERGDYDRAMECFQKCLSFDEESGNKQEISISIGNMGSVFGERGDYDHALECYQKCLSIAEELGDKRGIATAIGNMGNVFYGSGDYDRAMECDQKCLSIAEELGNKRGISSAVGNLGYAFIQRADYDRAMECYQKQLSIAEELGDKGGISSAVGNMGLVFMDRGEYDRALEFFQKHLSIAEELGNRGGISLAVGNMGIVCFEIGDYQLAEELLERAVGICRELNLKPLLANFLPTQARLALAQNQLPRAKDLCRKALSLSQELKNDKLNLQAQILSHKIEFFSASDKAARTSAVESLTALLEQTHSDEPRADIHYELAAMYRTDSETRPLDKHGGLSYCDPDQAEHHRLEAIRLYESLYAKIPKFDFKKRLEELAGKLLG